MPISIDELPAALEGIAERIKEEMNSRILFAAGLAMEAEMKDRIFGEGKDINGNSIGVYSVKPGYFSKDQFVRLGAFKPQGKNGFVGEKIVQTAPGKFKVKKEKPKTMYLKEGYKEFRDVQGRQTAHVDAKLSGDLEKSIQTVKITEGVVYIAITDPLSSEKRKGIEERFKKANEIFTGGEADKAVFIKALNDEVEHLRSNGFVS